jgi:hypothetical protein
MQNNPSPDARAAAARSDESGDETQRRVLLELVTDPPPGGEDAALLAARLSLDHERVEVAVAALGAAGLADSTGGLVRPTAAARRFDALWPVRP